MCAIKAPAFGERRKSILQDIAIVTAGEFIGKDLGMNVEGVQVDQLGTARYVLKIVNTIFPMLLPTYHCYIVLFNVYSFISCPFIFRWKFCNFQL